MIRFSLRNPYLIVVIALIVLVLGVTTLFKIPADLLPIFKTPAVQIITFYPGMPPVVMERDIMSRLQRWTGQSVGIEHQEAKAMLGVCIVKDFFREGVSLDTAMSQVNSYAMSDMFYLPPGTIPPMIMPFDPTASVPLCLISVSSSREPQTEEERNQLSKELYDIAYYELRNRLQSIQGVIAPAVYGGRLRRILAYVDREKLETRGLSLMDVQQAMLRESVLIPAGNAKIDDLDYQLFSNAIPREVEMMNDLPIKVVNGATIRIRDVGEVRDSSQIQTNIVRINGSRPAMYIPIYRQPGANTIEIVDAINSRLERILERITIMEPEKAKGLQLNVVMDQSVGVRQSIRGLQLAAGLGAGLAGLIVLLFLRSWRLTGIVILAVPLSLLASVIGLFYTGDTINSMTLGGLALAVGILVDQAIVVLDNIVRHRSMGKEAVQAALDGTREVALPLGVSILTFIVVFYPVVFLSGLARYLFTPLAVAVSFAVLTSYLLALCFIPVCAAKLLGNQTPNSLGETQRGLLALMSRSYRSLLAFLLEWKFAVVLLSLAAFVGTILLLFRTGTELFPQVDSGQFTIFVRMRSGTKIEKTDVQIQQILNTVEETIGKPDPNDKDPHSNLRLHIANMGVLMDWPAAYTPNTGPMDAFVLVQLKQKPGQPSVFQYVSALRQKLNHRFPNVEFSFDTGGMLTAAMNMGEASPIHVQITGSNLETHQEIAHVVRDVMARVPGTTDVRIMQQMDYPNYQIEIDRMLAADQGVTTEDVMKNLVSATNSSINFQPAFWIDERNGNHYFMGVQYAEEDINSLDSLKDIPVTGKESSRPVLLRNVAKLKRGTGPAVITHRNITRTTDILCNVLPGYDVGNVAAAIEQKLQDDPHLGLKLEQTERGQVFQIAGDYRGQGYALELQGEVPAMRQAFWQFSWGLVIAVTLIFLVMVALFRSFLTPIVVIGAVPLGFIGVVLLLTITGTHLSIMAFMGIIMMVGIVVEYSIVLIDFANHRVEEGLNVEEAVLDAAQVRLRPILMTSLTTWLALLPMAIGFAGGDANVPLARAIIGGVLGATVLTLLVVPCLYTIVQTNRGSVDRQTTT